VIWRGRETALVLVKTWRWAPFLFETVTEGPENASHEFNEP